MTQEHRTAPEMFPVVSSNIESVGHDGDALYVKFKDGGLYRYDGALRDHFDALRSAVSAGRYFHGTIKGKFPHQRIDERT